MKPRRRYNVAVLHRTGKWFWRASAPSTSGIKYCTLEFLGKLFIPIGFILSTVSLNSQNKCNGNEKASKA